MVQCLRSFILSFPSYSNSSDHCGEQIIFPKSFKALLGELNEDWAGSAQHDTEEVMVWILDKLHEDLSRIKKKPYVEKGEGDGSNCVKVAAEEWRYLQASLSMNSLLSWHSFAALPYYSAVIVLRLGSQR